MSKLKIGLLTEADLDGYKRRAARSGTLRSLGYQEVFDQLRELDADKPQCLKGYLGGISGPAFDTLEQAPAAMAVFAGSEGSFGQVIVAVPAELSTPMLDQPFRAECSKITADLPGGGTMTISIRELDVASLGEHVRAFRGKVTVAGKESVMLSETVQTDDFVLNIQLQGGDKKTLETLAKRALRKAGQHLA